MTIHESIEQLRKHPRRLSETFMGFPVVEVDGGYSAKGLSFGDPNIYSDAMYWFRVLRPRSEHDDPR